MADLFVIGLGIIIPDHITRQASEALARCSEIYSIVQEPSHLWNSKATGPQSCVRNLLDLYVEGRPRVENYDVATRTVINALRPGRHVAYVTYGNPMSYDKVAQDLVKRAKASHLSFQIIPGISSLDALFCDLGIDMAPAVQVYDASWLLAGGIRPLLDVAVILMQVGLFGSLVTHYSERKSGQSLSKLVEYLSEFYPPAHVVSLVRSTASQRHPALVRSVELNNLCEVTSEELSGTSLYIPASRQTDIRDDFLDLMQRT